MSSQASSSQNVAVFLPPRQPIVLASGSVVRRQLLQQAGVPVQVHPVDVNEPALRAEAAMQGLSVSATALRLAEAKAEACVKVLLESGVTENCVVLGADQILEQAGQVFNKPADMQQARQQLLQLRGTQQHLHTAVTLWGIKEGSGEKLWSHVETPRLTMRDFSETVLDRYLEVEGKELLYCVGACKVEGPGAQLFSQMEGAQDAILGLPLLPVLAALRQQGVLPD